MRTTVSIDERLLAAAKRRAQTLGLTLGQLIEESLRRELGRTPMTRERPSIPVFTKGTGPQPGIDVTSNRALLELHDEGQPLEQLR